MGAQQYRKIPHPYSTLLKAEWQIWKLLNRCFLLLYLQAGESFNSGISALHASRQQEPSQEGGRWRGESVNPLIDRPKECHPLTNYFIVRTLMEMCQAALHLSYVPVLQHSRVETAREGDPLVKWQGCNCMEEGVIIEFWKELTSETNSISNYVTSWRMILMILMQVFVKPVIQI